MFHYFLKGLLIKLWTTKLETNKQILLRVLKKVDFINSILISLVDNKNDEVEEEENKGEDNKGQENPENGKVPEDNVDSIAENELGDNGK